jgi:hypothetical protein
MVFKAVMVSSQLMMMINPSQLMMMINPFGQLGL